MSETNLNIHFVFVLLFCGTFGMDGHHRLELLVMYNSTCGNNLCSCFQLANNVLTAGQQPRPLIPNFDLCVLLNIDPIWDIGLDSERSLGSKPICEFSISSICFGHKRVLEIKHIISKITCYILPIDCLLIALDAHMLRHNGYGPGPGPMAQKGRPHSGGNCALFGPWAEARARIHYD